MNPLIDAAIYGVIAVGALAVCWGVARMIEPACYDKPKAKDAVPENLDRLVRTRRTVPIEYAEGHCINCGKAEMGSLRDQLQSLILSSGRIDLIVDNKKAKFDAFMDGNESGDSNG